MEPAEATSLFTDVANLWLGAGVLLLLVETIVAPGIGLLFAGLGALVAGAALCAGWLADDAVAMQFTVFFVASGVSAIMLWKPMQRMKHKHKSEGYSNVVGETAQVAAGGIARVGGGNALWSGTIMKAELCPRCTVERLEEGVPVTIVEVRGATLVVTPKLH